MRSFFVNYFPGSARVSAVPMRIFDKEEYADSFIGNGYIRFNSIGKLRREFSDKEGGVNDSHEGVAAYLTDFKLEVRSDKNGELYDLTKNLLGGARFSYDGVEDWCVYCFYAPSFESGRNVEFEDSLLLDHIVPCEKMTAGGSRDWVVVLHKMDLLKERVRKAVENIGGEFSCGYVKYFDVNDGAWPAKKEDAGLLKRSEFSYQNEYRFIVKGIKPDESGLLEVEVGDINSLAIKVQVGDLRERLDFKERT